MGAVPIVAAAVVRYVIEKNTEISRKMESRKRKQRKNTTKGTTMQGVTTTDHTSSTHTQTEWGSLLRDIDKNITGNVSDALARLYHAHKSTQKKKKTKKKKKGQTTNAPQEI